MQFLLLLSDLPDLWSGRHLSQQPLSSFLDVLPPQLWSFSYLHFFSHVRSLPFYVLQRHIRARLDLSGSFSSSHAALSDLRPMSSPFRSRPSSKHPLLDASLVWNSTSFVRKIHISIFVFGSLTDVSPCSKRVLSRFHEHHRSKQTNKQTKKKKFAAWRTIHLSLSLSLLFWWSIRLHCFGYSCSSITKKIKNKNKISFSGRQLCWQYVSFQLVHC